MAARSCKWQRRLRSVSPTRLIPELEREEARRPRVIPHPDRPVSGAREKDTRLPGATGKGVTRWRVSAGRAVGEGGGHIKRVPADGVDRHVMASVRLQVLRVVRLGRGAERGGQWSVSNAGPVRGSLRTARGAATLEHLWMRPSSVPTRNRCSDSLEKSKQQPPASPLSEESSSSTGSPVGETSRSVIRSE